MLCTSLHILNKKKMNESKIVIHSKDRSLFSNSSSDFDIKLPLPLINVEHVELDYCQIPTTFYNVTENNNVLSWRENGGSQLFANIPVGYYTANNLISEVASLMTQTSGVRTYQGLYNSQTFKYRIEIDASTFRFEFENVGNSCAKILGFHDENTSYEIYHDSTFVPMLYPLWVLIDIEEINSQTLSSTTSLKLSTFFIPINVNGGSYLEYEKDLAIKQIAYPRYPTIETLHIKLRDESGNLLNLNGSEWTFVMKIVHRK